MKVVLFCGGLGTRLREHSDTIPKPLVNIGDRPILWHLMRYYAHFGHTEFILCLGYKSELIREYFLRHDEAMTNDFTLHTKDRRVDLHSRDLNDWKITFLDTGRLSNIGERLMRVRRFVEKEELFLANYADGLSDLPLDRHVQNFLDHKAVASIAAMRSNQSFHAVHAGEDGMVTRLDAMSDQPLWVNGGFFVMRPEIFEYMRDGEDLVGQPFQRLIGKRKLATYHWSGFWQCMDTFKDKITLDHMDAQEECPWKLWEQRSSAPPE
jgi:glucose-1-phosphate cytidylyltransferase